MIHMYTKIWTWPGNADQSNLGADGDVLVVPVDFQSGHCSSSLGYPGQYFRLGSLTLAACKVVLVDLALCTFTR